MIETLCFEGHFKRRMARYKEFCHERAEVVLDQFLKKFCNQWLQDEYEEQSGAARYERSEGRKDRRNGHYERAIITRRGIVKVKVPRGESRQYRYTLFDKYQRRTVDFDEAVVEALVLGHSSRKAEKFFKKLLGEGTVSHATAAKTLRTFEAQVEQWHKRPLRDEAVVLIVDAVYFRGVGNCCKAARPVLFALAVYGDGCEEVVGFHPAQTESHDAWYRFFAELYDRGLRHVRLIVHDDHGTIRPAVTMIWPRSLDQLCVFHLMQNVTRHLRGDRNKRAIIEGLQAVYRSKNEREFWRRLGAFRQWWRHYQTHAAIRYVVKSAANSISYFALEERFWPVARTTNRLERLFEEFNRRVAAFRRFPNTLSCERWLFALLKQNGKITAVLQSQQNS